MTIIVILVITLISLAEATLFWLYEMLKWRLFLKGKIDSIALICPVEGFVFALITWIPAVYVLGLINGDVNTSDLRGLWAFPGFFLWALILRKPMNLWRTHMAKTTKLSTEREKELARTNEIAEFLVSGGL